MNGHELAALLAAALPLLEASRDELRDLDAAIGDGDLGITVADGAAAILRDLPAGDESVLPAKVLQVAAAAFSAANPSTLSALVAGGLLAAAKGLGESAEVDRAGAIGILSAAIERIKQRGKSVPGDKTILDAMAPSLEALTHGPDDSTESLSLMVTAARTGVESTTGLVSRRGRAAWVGDRSIGHPDGGGTAYLRLLEAFQRAWSGTVALP
ncbi:dihydroxyacetone kinase-like protein [Nakamurella sp. UYEF19]|uniref:DAK2 domain-containing protein n=1 Tax=Nakamurella sp. UYEF19 TaxID=1756392 RepID=UPI003399DBC6